MRIRNLLLSFAIVFAAGQSFAAKVYVMSSGDTATDNAVMANMQRFAHQATLGVQYPQFDGTQSLTGYDSVYMQSNYNWGSGDMPLDGQAALAAFVNNGGGLVSAEWALWKASIGYYQTLATIYPAVATSSYNHNTEYDFQQVTPDPIMNAGLPASFVMAANDFGGTETEVAQTRVGATVFYNSNFAGSRLGLTGWDFGNGRVVSFSTTNGPNMLNDPNGGRLISNAIEWVGHGAHGVVAFPSAKTIQFGKLDSGDLSQLQAIDGQNMRVCKFFVPNLLVAPVTVQLDSTSTISSPAALSFRTFSRMSAAGSFSITLDLYDWSISGYSPTSTVTAPISNPYASTILNATGGTLSRFVGPGGAIRARYRIKATGFVATAAWCHDLDQAIWFIR